jgi:hypothetical protein
VVQATKKIGGIYFTAGETILERPIGSVVHKLLQRHFDF